MDKFSALADPTRRSIVELLASRGPLSASEICKKYPVSISAISQHLKVLRESNLVLMQKQAQKRIYMINAAAMVEMEQWANRLTQKWIERFDALERILETEKYKLR